ncbi:hypothetical protein [Bacillus toyonensis]|uniref:hypothetical protein n=1 Tax=Bacillus toyonensis TaxID=155322 RepID=UPI0020D281BF|nr:hypothetical protein [Bacillus toyonensis]
MTKTFGKYNLDNPVTMGESPSNEKESRDYANALAQGSYPVGVSDCFTVGISGGCGLDCHVYLDGKCEEHEEMIPELRTQEDKELHQELYTENNL